MRFGIRGKRRLGKALHARVAAIGLLGALAAGGRLASTLGAVDPNRFVQGTWERWLCYARVMLSPAFSRFAAGKARREAAGKE